MKKLKGKLILDAALSVLLVAAMFMEVTGVFWHEIIGFTLFTGIVTHLILERKWIMRTLKRAKNGQMSADRVAKTVVAVLLVVAMVVMAVTSILISTILRDAGFSLIPYSAHGLCVSVHTGCAYVICALCLVHLVLHWRMIAGVLHVPYDPSRRKAINTGFGVVTGLSVLALSVSLADALDVFDAVKGVNGENHKKTDGGSRGDRFNEDVKDRSADGLDSSERPQHGPKGKGKRRGYSEGETGESETRRKNDAGTSNGSSSSGNSSNGNSSKEKTPSTDSSSASGICPLCKKRCSLSDPRCNWPYEQGLI